MRNQLLLFFITFAVQATPGFDHELADLYQRKPWLAPKAVQDKRNEGNSTLKRRALLTLFGLVRGYTLYRARCDAPPGGACLWLVPGIVRSIYHYGIVAGTIIQLSIELGMLDKVLTSLAALG